MVDNPLPASSIGSTAHRLISANQDAPLLGITSRGIFLRLASSWVVFLTSERWRGPLTVNLPNWLAALSRLQPGDRVEIAAGELVFPRSSLAIQTAGASVWQAPPPPKNALDPAERQKRWSAQIQDILDRKAANDVKNIHGEKRENKADFAAADFEGFFPLLLGGEPRLPGQPSLPLLDSYAQIRGALKALNTEAAGSALLPFLGLGSGLTPSGDDLVIGFLLALNRWGELLAPHLPPHPINQILIQAASGKTSRLSASLIACACQGQADERLVLVLDGLMTGDPQPSECSQLLASWGSTSGFDFLTGAAFLFQ